MTAIELLRALLEDDHDVLDHLPAADQRWCERAKDLLERRATKKPKGFDEAAKVLLARYRAAKNSPEARAERDFEADRHLSSLLWGHDDSGGGYNRQVPRRPVLEGSGVRRVALAYGLGSVHWFGDCSEYG